MIEVAGAGKKMRNRILIILGAVVFVVAAAAAVYYFIQYKKITDDPSAVSKATTERLKGEVGRIYQLPNDEDPTIAKVEDKEKLKDQQFFSKAENGDYILIYTKAKLALLYREKERRLVNVGPITISDQSETQPIEETQPVDQPPAEDTTDADQSNQ
jgi:hypothetical protein